MIANVSLEKIGKTIQEADSILIFPHINPDGDAIGSACEEDFVIHCGSMARKRPCF